MSTTPAPRDADKLLSKAEMPTPSVGRLSKDPVLALFEPKSDISPAPSQPKMFGQFQSPQGQGQ